MNADGKQTYKCPKLGSIALAAAVSTPEPVH
jgi:hypothetical protein